MNELKKELYFLSTILLNVENSIIITDLDGTIIYWNKGAEKIFGYSDAEMIGRTTASLYFQEDLHLAGFDLKEIQAGNEYRGEWRGKKKNGEEVWLNIHTSLMKDKEGKIIGIIGVSTDITEKKLSRDQLNASRNRMAMTLDNVGLILIDIDLEKKEILPSGNLIRFLGYHPYELKFSFSFWESIIHTDDLEEIREKFQSLIEDGYPFYHEVVRLKRKDGSWFWAFSSAKVTEKNPDGSARKIVAVVVDIDDKYLLGARLKSSQHNMDLLLDHAPIILVKVNETGKVEFVRGLDAQANGLSGEEMGGRDFEEIINEYGFLEKGIQPGFFEKIKKVVFEEKGRFVFKSVFNGRNFKLTMVPLNDKKDEVKQILGIGVDVTDLENACKALEKSNRELEILTDSIEKKREEEKRALARELHDKVGQNLTALKLNLFGIKNRSINGDGGFKDFVTKNIRKAIEIIDFTLDSTRKLTRDLNPVILDALGLVPAIEHLIRTVEEKGGKKIKLKVKNISSSYKPDLANSVYRIIQDSLNYCWEQSNVNFIHVYLEEKEGELEIIVGDDGNGAVENSVDQEENPGLIGLKERIKKWNGKMEIFHPKESEKRLYFNLKLIE